ncbi:MAG: GxxExxY protein [Patescibacteria group bacterium]|nr:GxxExxY protein [Patescibacteria group bacterium]
MRRELIYKDLSYKITGVLFQVHNDLGRYKNEKQYSDYFEKLLKENNINYSREFRINNPKNKTVRSICDFIIENKIIIEIKAVSFIDREFYFQIKRYLTDLNLELGLLVNFRQKCLTPKRILNGNLLKKDN